MEFLKPYLTWQVGLGLGVLLSVLAYFLYPWVMSLTSGFLDLGQECDPQIENACGENAKCQADETGEKGICFPIEEEAENVDSE